MKLLLLRHGIAADQDPSRIPDDSLRPLTSRGEQQVGEVAKTLRRLELGIDTIWCSPFVRTRQTAAAVAKKLSLENRLQVREELAPDGDSAKLLAELASFEPKPASVLLIGHEPYLSRLLSVIASGGSSVRVELKKGGLARLDVTGPLGLHRCAVLQWLLPPRLLVKIRQ